MTVAGGAVKDAAGRLHPFCRNGSDLAAAVGAVGQPVVVAAERAKTTTLEYYVGVAGERNVVNRVRPVKGAPK